MGGIGAMGDELRDASAGIGFTGFIRTQPMTFGMVEVAGLYSKMDFVHYWAINPSMIFLLASYSDFQFGLAGGVGFYHSSVPGATRFGLSGGAHFDMSIDTNLSMGFQMKAHKVLSDEVLDQWSLMVTLAYKWRGGGW